MHLLHNVLLQSWVGESSDDQRNLTLLLNLLMLQILDEGELVFVGSVFPNFESAEGAIGFAPTEVLGGRLGNVERRCEGTRGKGESALGRGVGVGERDDDMVGV